MRTFLMVAHGTDGDVLPVIRIGAELGRRGHTVALLSHARYARRARAAGLRFVAIDTPGADERSQADDGADINSLGSRQNPERVREYYRQHGFLAQFRLECRALRRLHTPGRTTLVGLATSSLSVLTAAELLGVPAICLCPSPFHGLVLDRLGDEYRQIFPDLDPVRGEFGLPPIGDWTAWLLSASGYVGLWPEWFDAAGPRARDGIQVSGFVLADEDSSDQDSSDRSWSDWDSSDWDSSDRDWSDRGSSDRGSSDRDLPYHPEAGTVLIAGSSGRLTGSAFYSAAIGGVRLAGRRALVVTRERELLPDPLPPGVDWYPRLPFRELMPRVSAVIHHGGIGISTRALTAGTPQLLLPDGFDRPDNAQRLAALGLADWLPVGLRASGSTAEPVRGNDSAGGAGPADVTRVLATLPAKPAPGPIDALPVAVGALEG